MSGDQTGQPNVIHLSKGEVSTYLSITAEEGGVERIRATVPPESLNEPSVTYVHEGIVRKIERIARQGENGGAHDVMTSCTRIRGVLLEVFGGSEW